jgi:hypothetical protein
VSKIVPIKQINLFRSLGQLANDADHIVARHAELKNIRRTVVQQKAALENGAVIGEIIEAQRAKLTEYDKTVLARCDKLLEQLDPPGIYEDDDREEGDLRRSVVSVRLASMIGAFPNANPGDPDVYVGLLLEHVCAEGGIRLLALDTACRKIVATQKFVPTVSEMIAVLGEQQELWNDRLWSLAAITDTSHWIVTEVAKLQVEAQKAALARTVRWARAQRDKAIANAVEAQKQAACAAQAVARKTAELAECEARVSEVERALAEVVERNTGTEPP